VATIALIEGDAPFQLSGHTTVSALSTANAPQLGLIFKAGFIVIGALASEFIRDQTWLCACAKS
jgi:hypothetical protein